MLPCFSSFFSTNCLSVNNPSVVPLPFLNPCCSSPISHSIFFLIRPSNTLSSSFRTWLSRVIPLYFPGSCTSPFIFHIGMINPVRHSTGVFPSVKHEFRSLRVQLTTTSPARSSISTRISSKPVAFPLCIFFMAAIISVSVISTTSFSHVLNLGVPVRCPLSYAAVLLNRFPIHAALHCGLWLMYRSCPWSLNLSSHPYFLHFCPVPSCISFSCHHLHPAFCRVPLPFSVLLCQLLVSLLSSYVHRGPTDVSWLHSVVHLCLWSFLFSSKLPSFRQPPFIWPKLFHACFNLFSLSFSLAQSQWVPQSE